MARVPHRASSANKTTKKITPTRRQATKSRTGKPRPASPGKAPRPNSSQARATSADRPNVRSAINKALSGILKLAERLGAREGVNGPAALVQLVLRTLIFMLERDDERFQLAYQRAVIAFSEAVRAASSEASGQVDGAGARDGGAASAASAPPAAAPPSPPSPPPQKDVRRPADPHLRALGIEFHACTDELGQATIADMMALLFVGDDDPALAIQDSVRRDVRIIRDALRSADGVDMVDTEAIGMALWQIESRLIVARELYMRVREDFLDERAEIAAAKGGRS
ncbi:hypothetical protein [Sorangium sp. So ce693]|uniref:hypothetical protein n=1 Tax=Sorangium sp. So ce693 TaxID=3133318 RepID=UPI003F633C45